MSFIKKVLTLEPVNAAAIATSVVTATFTILRVFNVVDLTEDQQIALLAGLTAFAPIGGLIVRAQVTPTAKLPDTTPVYGNNNPDKEG